MWGRCTPATFDERWFRLHTDITKYIHRRRNYGISVSPSSPKQLFLNWSLNINWVGLKLGFHYPSWRVTGFPSTRVVETGLYSFHEKPATNRQCVWHVNLWRIIIGQSVHVYDTIKPRLHQMHVLAGSRTSNLYSDTNGYKWIQLVSGLHAYGVNATLGRYRSLRMVWKNRKK